MPLIGLPLLCLIFCCLTACSQSLEPEPEPIVFCEEHCPDHESTHDEPALLACDALMHCTAACEHEGCEDHCRDLATPLAILEYDDLDRCKRVFCDPLKDFESLEECTALLCPHERGQCKGLAPEDKPRIGQLHCDALLDCQSRCQEQTHCPRACMNESTVLARRELFHLQQCLSSHCTDGPLAELEHHDCADTLCPSELFSCIGLPQGEASCLELVHCTASCHSDACRRDCYALGTAKAQESYLRLMDCTYQDCSNLHQSGEVTSCHADRCASELDACLVADDLHWP